MKHTEVRLAALAIAATAALAGCSGSSSSGGTSPSSTPTSVLTVGGTPLASAGAAGPNGDITAPATNTPGPGSPGGSVVFPHITNRLHNELYPKLGKVHGVRTVTYYPQFNQLQVFFTPKATSTDRARVDQIVSQAQSG